MKKMASRVFSLLLALSISVTAPVAGGAAVYAGELEAGEGTVISGEAAGDVQRTGEEQDAQATEEGTKPEESMVKPEAGVQEGLEAPESDLDQNPTPDQVTSPSTELESESASVEEMLPAAEPLAEATGDWADYADSTWTADQPIMDEADFAQFAVLSQTQTFSGTTVTLGADLDLSAHLWTPISGAQNYAFEGVFDGGNHQIIGLNTGTRSLSAGLFGYIKGSSTIKNLRLTIEEVKVVTSVNESGAGGLVGYMAAGTGGQIFNCQATVSGTIIGEAANTSVATWIGAGGLIGTDYSGITVNNCFVHVKPQAVIRSTCGKANNGHAGGFIGVSVSATIINSKSTLEGTLIGQAGNGAVAAAAGGFIGWGDRTKLENCYSISYPTATYSATASSTSTTDSSAAPFCGYTYANQISISNCYAIDFGATYDLQTNNKRQGAILGGTRTVATSKSTLSNCYYYTVSGAPAYTGNVTATNMVEVDTLEAMKKEATYATFDFVDTWTIVEGLNEGYPVLQMELTDQQKTDIVTGLLQAEKSFIVADNADETVKLAAVQAYVDSVITGSLFAKAGGTATAAKVGNDYQVTFRLATVQEQRNLTATFVQSGQTKAQMMAEAVSTIPANVELLLANAEPTQLEKKMAVETYILSLLSPLDFYKANGTYTVTLNTGSIYSVELHLDGVDSQTVPIAVNFPISIEGSLTQTTSGALVDLFNSTTGYESANTLIHMAPTTVLETGKTLVYMNNGTQVPLYWSSVANCYIGLIPLTGLDETTIRSNLRVVKETVPSIRYGIVGAGRNNRSKIGFADLNYFDKTALIDGVIPEGDVERVLAMDVNCDGSLSVSDLMSIIKKYVFNEEFSKAN